MRLLAAISRLNVSGRQHQLPLTQPSLTVSVAQISVNTPAPLIGCRLNTFPPSQLNANTISVAAFNPKQRSELRAEPCKAPALLFLPFAGNRNILLCNMPLEAPPLKRWYVGRQTAAVEVEAPEADYCSTVFSLYGQYNQTPTS